MNNLPYVEAHMEHYYDLRREADQQRLAREARKAAGKDKPFYLPALAWIRCHLMLLGQKLNRRQSNQRAAPMRALAERSSVTPCQS